jgi:hypothetical protein
MAVASGRIAGERQGQQTCQAFINARSRVREMNRKRISPALCLFVLSTGGLPTAPAQIPPGGVKDRPQFAPLPVRIRQDSGVTSRWKLLHAALQESIIGVWGVLDIENASTLTMQWDRVYAEHIDAAGRLSGGGPHSPSASMSFPGFVTFNEYTGSSLVSK